MRMSRFQTPHPRQVEESSGGDHGGVVVVLVRDVDDLGHAALDDELGALVAGEERHVHPTAFCGESDAEDEAKTCESQRPIAACWTEVQPVQLALTLVGSDFLKHIPGIPTPRTLPPARPPPTSFEPSVGPTTHP